MRQRLFYASGTGLLLFLIALVVLQGSIGEFGPRSNPELYLFWAMSTLIFVLTVTVAFMLFRTAVLIPTNIKVRTLSLVRLRIQRLQHRLALFSDLMLTQKRLFWRK